MTTDKKRAKRSKKKAAMACGAVKDEHDIRDYPIRDHLSTEPLPQTIDLSSNFLEIRNQGNEGTCVAFASAAAKEWMEGFSLSPRFLYDRIALLQGGAYPRDVMKVLAQIGVPNEECQPYKANEKTLPCDKALEHAAPNKIKAYARLLTILDMKRCLLDHGPFLAAFGINAGWFNTKDGTVAADGEVTGGHAVTICGYNNYLGMLKFRNSWGKGWGDGGYGYISYSDAVKSLWDAWSFVDIPDDEEEKPPRPPISEILGTIMAWLQDIIKKATDIIPKNPAR